MLTVIDRVNEKILNGLKEDEDAPYNGKDLNIVSISTRTPDAFPTLSVVSLGEITAASDLCQTEQASIWSTVELKVYSDKTLYETTKLMEYAGDILLSLGYQITTGPEVLSDTRPFCKVARFRGYFGAGDLEWRFQ